jgi:hypothetical protein
MRLGYSSLFGYESLGLIRPRSIIHWSMNVEPPADTDFPEFTVLDQRLPWPAPGFGLTLGYDPVAKVLVERDQPDSPRAWLAASIEQVADWRQAGRQVAAGTAPPRHAYVEQPLSLIDGSKAVPSGTIQFTGYGINHVSLQVESDRPALLVLAEPWYPGWQVRVNEEPAQPALPVNGWMRAGLVPAGKSNVEFVFRSRWLPLGLVISGLALAASLFAVRRRPPTPSSPAFPA